MADKERRTDGHEKARQDTKKEEGRTADCADLADKERRMVGHEKAREDTKKDAGASKRLTADCSDMADKGRHGFLESVLSAQSAVPSLFIFAPLCG